jgi:serine/threonine protein kinase
VQTLAAQEGGTITVVGTYGYMPPEQFGGRTTPASDLYSLGATLIYLVTGLHPTELPQQQLQIQFRQSVNLTSEFADWLEWMTEPSLEQRFSVAEAALQALEKPRPRKQQISISKQPLKQPPASKIRLIKTPETLEIILPPKGFSIYLIGLISFLTPLALGFHFTTIGWLSGFKEISYFLQFVGIILLAIVIYWGFCKRTRIVLDSQNLDLIQDFLRKEWQASPLLTREDIFKLKLLNLSHKNYNPYHLSYSLPGSATYYLQSFSHLTVAELEWLMQEVNDWLGLSISEEE